MFQEIFTDKIQYTPGKYTAPNQCHTCGKTDVKLSNCSRCHIAKYCGNLCLDKAWPEHKKVCPKLQNENSVEKLTQQLEQARNPGEYASYIPLAAKQRREFQRHYDIQTVVKQCFKIGEVKLAKRYIVEQTYLPVMRQRYFEDYAEIMLTNPSNVESVLATGNAFINNEMQVIKTVVNRLVKFGYFDAALTLAQRVTNQALQSLLVESVASALMVAGRYQEAKQTADEIPDQTTRENMMRMLNRYL